MGQAISAFVLDGGHGTWPDELKHDDSGAPESHSHTCRKQRGRITPGVEELDAGGSQNVPASGILAWVDGRVGARDGHGACWDTHPWLGQARQIRPGVQACQVAETWRKTHERHCVHHLDVTLDDLLFGEPHRGRDRIEVGAVVLHCDGERPRTGRSGSRSRSLYHVAQMRGGRTSMTKRD